MNNVKQYVITLFSLVTLSAQTVILQQGLNGYSGFEDTFIGSGTEVGLNNDTLDQIKVSDCPS